MAELGRRRARDADRRQCRGIGEVRRGQEQGFCSCGYRPPWLTSRIGMILPAPLGGLSGCPIQGKSVSQIRVIFPGPRGARPGHISSSGRRPRRESPNASVRLVDGDASEQVEVSDLCGGGILHRVGSAARPATGRGPDPRRRNRHYRAVEPYPPATPLQPFWTPRHNDFGPQIPKLSSPAGRSLMSSRRLTGAKKIQVAGPNTEVVHMTPATPTWKRPSRRGS